MRCPKCDAFIDVEDYADDAPFECEHCSALIRVVMDRDTDEPMLELIDPDAEELVDFADDDSVIESEYEEYAEEDDDFDDNYNDEYDPNY